MTSPSLVGSGSEAWGSRRVLVTGATGMLGSWLVRELLKRGASVVALVRDQDPQSELLRSGDYLKTAVVNGRLEEFETLERAINLHEVDTVFHLGAQTLVGVAERFPLATFEANIRGSYNLLEACRIHGDLVQRVVVASSDKAYGERDDLPYVEGMPMEGRHPYEVSKSCTDLIARSYHHSYDMPVAVVRCGNLYGGADLNWSRLVPGTIRSLLRGERPVIRSDGTYLRDYLYVKDAADGLLLLSDHLGIDGVAGSAFNFSPEQPHSVLDVVDVLRRCIGREDLEPELLDSAQGEIRHQYLSSIRARETLGWRPAYSLEDGLSETIEWYRGFLS